jgi:hypothetical protein
MTIPGGLLAPGGENPQPASYGYASSTQPVVSTGPKQIRVMSLNDCFSTVSVTNARSSALFQILS